MGKTGCRFDNRHVWSSSPVDPPPVVDSTQEFQVVCGKGSGCPDGDEQPAVVSEKHSVRCCADNQVGPGWKKRDQCDVWATSLWPDCHETSFAEATQLCGLAGARLCTKTELADMCTFQTGCGFDNDLIWSSSPVD